MSATWYEALPVYVRRAVIGQIGGVKPGPAATDPHTSCAAGIVIRGDGERVFLKASSRIRNPHSAASQGYEVIAANLVAPLGISPRLIRSLSVDEWSVLLVHEAPGRPADYSPGSADLPLLVQALRAVGTVQLAPGSGLPTVVDRFGPHLAPAHRSLLQGSSLLHYDVSPGNTRVSNDGTLALLDWGRASIGPAWVEAAGMYRWLVYAGHTHTSAMRWVLEVCPAWNSVSRSARSAYLAAARSEIPDPPEHCEGWLPLLVGSA
ncbi:phosphotransferase [Embleya hyalina]|uniref:Aminoglycoside phosphotransferase domain-containing protein n=1 Tax=Embleya hyalina TaxID=516124 RepID=A0A401YZ81_9ACTN|nr:phosphotransferase [Embleya hyalina]GCD99897.1 hypothetical protein EHYA_07619 [Embleya hyalina]